MDIVTELKTARTVHGLNPGVNLPREFEQRMLDEGYLYIVKAFTRDESDRKWSAHELRFSDKGEAALKTALVIRSATPVSMEAAWDMLQNYTQMYGYCPELAALYGQKQRMYKETASESVCAG